MESHFLENKFFIVSLRISIVIDVFDFLKCFIDIIIKYKFHDERMFSVN